MVLNKELVNKLRRLFDLNLYEVKIWVHLLSRGISTAGELSDLSNVPRSRAYDVLESLQKKSFVVMKLGKPIQYVAVPPEEVLNRYKKVVKENAEVKIQEIEGVKESNMINQLNSLYTKGIQLYNPTDLSGAFRGRKSVYNQIESMIKNASSNVKIVTTEEGLLRKLEAFKSTIKKAHERGVKIHVSAPITKKNEDVVKSFKGLINFKENKSSNTRFCVIDESSILMMLLNDDEVHPDYDVGVWINSKSMGRAFSKMFDSNW